ncbi:hypothetical protein [Actinocorallia populi]|uniref:hypothetical protein n=1 Tax=Actinocorallia populi TaxID=2079200 RepID=UPI000D0912EB|nr:hypothetical protein [Actinocorallia populi]
MKRLLHLGDDWPASVVLIVFMSVLVLLGVGADAEQVNVVLNAGTLMVTVLVARDVRGPGHGLLA